VKDGTLASQWLGFKDGSATVGLDFHDRVALFTVIGNFGFPIDVV